MIGTKAISKTGSSQEENTLYFSLQYITISRHRRRIDYLFKYFYSTWTVFYRRAL